MVGGILNGSTAEVHDKRNSAKSRDLFGAFIGTLFGAEVYL